MRTGDRIGYTGGMDFTAPLHGIPEIHGASWIRASGERLPYPVLIRLGVGDDGRLVATGLLIETEGELTTRAARTPVAEIVTEIAALKPAAWKQLFAEMIGRPECAKDKRWRDWQPEAPEGFPAGLAADFVAVPARTRPVKRVRPGRRGYPDDYYRDIATRYAQAKRQHPRAPIRALMAELHATEPTVHRWLRTAREKGFIKATKEN